MGYRFRVWGLGFAVTGSKVTGLGFGVWGLRSWVRGLQV